MAVDALQLRPRTSLALYDAALRSAANVSGLWVITLPSSAALVLSFFGLAEAIRRGEALLIPTLWLTLAWALRCFTQGAASHHLEHTVLQPIAPSVTSSFIAAAKRLPSLLVAGALQLAIDCALFTLTLGIGFFFAGAHQAIFAAALRGEGSSLGLYQTASKLLGGARATAPFVRFGNSLQFVLVANVLAMTAFAGFLGQHVLALDLTFIDRFTSLDNPVWVTSVFVFAFSAFEPVRAALGVLLLIDGRVRHEGLDLVAQVEQLPRRKKPKAPLASVVTLVLFALTANAQNSTEPSVVRGRVERLVDECEMGPRVDEAEIKRLDSLPERDHAALTRFISRVERRAYDEQDCDAAEGDLREGLKELAAARALESDGAAEAARTDAKKILERPEFNSSTKTRAEPEKVVEENKELNPIARWFEKLLKRFFDWLNKRAPNEPPSRVAVGGEMAGANVVMVVVVLAPVAFLVFLALQLRRKPPTNGEVGTGGSGEQALSSDPMSALSKRPETWAGLADELAARGNYREAIRHLYLALLSHLHRAGFIDYDPTNSNWDYLFAFKGPGESKQAFRELTRRFDFAWYGNLDVTQAAYGAFRTIVKPLLATAEADARA